MEAELFHSFSIKQSGFDTRAPLYAPDSTFLKQILLDPLQKAD
jgi:hypothetical protein